MKRGFQKKLAKKLNISGAYLSTLINCKKRPNWPMAKKLAAATNTDPVIWLEGTPEQIKAAVSGESVEQRSSRDRRGNMGRRLEGERREEEGRRKIDDRREADGPCGCKQCA